MATNKISGPDIEFLNKIKSKATIHEDSLKLHGTLVTQLASNLSYLYTSEKKQQYSIEVKNIIDLILKNIVNRIKLFEQKIEEM
ncbi:hypothetical protein [Sutcliffiella cohnii]|uniref:hypothetical protein n=1 Tax=Sutcliffiella cohnii TaxID=33932 RepID=UPI002E1E07A0|nr:hypothetical protein [Sutcliffiella cohnii]